MAGSILATSWPVCLYIISNEIGSVVSSLVIDTYFSGFQPVDDEMNK